jgi:hypothetical protein
MEIASFDHSAIASSICPLAVNFWAAFIIEFLSSIPVHSNIKI